MIPIYMMPSTTLLRTSNSSSPKPPHFSHPLSQTYRSSLSLNLPDTVSHNQAGPLSHVTVIDCGTNPACRHGDPALIVQSSGHTLFWLASPPKVLVPRRCAQPQLIQSRGRGSSDLLCPRSGRSINPPLTLPHHRH